MIQSNLPRSTARVGFAATVAGLLAFGLAAPAAADPAEPYEGSVRGQYAGTAESGERIEVNGQRTRVSLFKLELENGDTLTTYCIDFETAIRNDAWYREDAWSNYPGQGDFAQPAKVHWVLQNGYPAIDTAALAEAAGATEQTTDEQALSATQAAIWHFSNGAELTQAHANTETIYEYLTENAEELPQTAEPNATLSITPGELRRAGATVGEFLVETSVEGDIPVELGDGVPEGVELIDLESGEAVDAVGNGDTVGFSVPGDAEDGSASFSLSATATVQTGRLFKGEDENTPTQTLITAQEGEVEVSASASATWTAVEEEPEPSPSPEPTPSPSPEPSPEPTPTPSDTPTPTTPPTDDRDQPSLPVTGGALAGLVAAGIAALGAGAGAIYLSRKRKSAANDSVEG
ncbi:peptidase [Nocardiopsis sp. CNR-923]|uniref:thioester domain-containing protein n=1 Tax=Nocardiopsis sp. CNR-923 TaxID=1904965 RepID=UPI00095A89D2|nr:thioester domain-containing protein [Nocardiopsis sp. CNR-923]OLT26805.1 peptidase [Nocardiopsis sp. CNR-923]